MYEVIREKIVAKYGSINKLSKVVDISAQDLYSAFNGNKPMYPKWRKMIEEALGERFEPELIARGEWNGTTEDLYDIVWKMSIRLRDLEDEVKSLKSREGV